MAELHRRHLLGGLALLTAAAGAGAGRAAAQSASGDSGGSLSTSGGPTRTDLDREATAALSELQRAQPGARALTERARAILIFPGIVKAAFGIGGLYGTGALRQGGRSVAYYNIAGASIGLQLGAQRISQAYFFNTEAALDGFRRVLGFELSADASLTAASFGAQGEVSTATLQQPVVVATWGQEGLMASLAIEGLKITEINPS